MPRGKRSVDRARPACPAAPAPACRFARAPFPALHPRKQLHVSLQRLWSRAAFLTGQLRRQTIPERVVVALRHQDTSRNATIRNQCDFAIGPFSPFLRLLATAKTVAANRRTVGLRACCDPLLRLSSRHGHSLRCLVKSGTW